MEYLNQIAKSFLPGFDNFEILTLKGGIIHETYKISCIHEKGESHFILQKINTNTFKNPEWIMDNIHQVQAVLNDSNYPLEVLQTKKNLNGEYLFFTPDNACWRMFDFIPKSISFEYLNDQDVLSEMGKAYGLFLSAIKDVDIDKIKEIIPRFHSLRRRFVEYQFGLKNYNRKRLKSAGASIKELVDLYDRFKSIYFLQLQMRPTHNDCKMSNVLFDQDTLKAKAVIDLDTLMPGYIVTDFGDMVRSVCNSVSEDEADLQKVFFNIESFKSLSNGFLGITKSWLTKAEKMQLLNGAIYIILEQALRFMTDYLNGDIYYQVNYSEHNLDRARNQIKLLNSMLKREEELKKILGEILSEKDSE